MSQETQIDSSDRGTEILDSTLKGLVRIGGASALICALMYLITLVIYVPANLASPPPTTVLEWLVLFQNSPFTGLFFLGLSDIIIMILWGPMSLALYAILKQSNKAWSMIATAFVFVGVVVFLATNVAFSMLFLSRQYAAAATEVEKSTILAAGQALIAISQGTGGRYTGMALTWISGVMLSAVMLRSKAFSRTTAWVGIVGLGLLVTGVPFGGHYTDTGTPTTLQSAIVALQYVGGGLLSLGWYILVGLRLLKIGRS
jgi:hypothetical protein